MNRRVILINSTPKPLETFYWAWQVMENPIPDSLEELHMSKGELEIFYEKVLGEGLATVLEYINTVWKFEGVSRAFQQQLCRHRLASYSIQSMRVISKENFAANHSYRFPPELSLAGIKHYAEAMNNIQKDYRKLLKLGIPVQDARGILPLNIFSTVTMAINFRSLISLISKRLCYKVQDEFKEIALLMLKEISLKMEDGEVLAKYIKSPCIMNGKCMVKKHNEECLSGQDKREVCPNYAKLFVKERT